jgi:hypothetical protein
MRLTLCLFVSLLAAPSFAQATRTWVSGVGDDVNPCSRTAPCKTLAGAISKTAAGGEINAIDPGGFGAVTITKAITIDLHNVLGGVLVSGTPAITINAGVNDVVVLRGLDMVGLRTGTFGVRFLAGKALHLEDSTIRGFANAGVSFEPTATTSQLFIRDTAIMQTNNATTPANAVNIVGGSATLDHVTLTDNDRGLSVSGAAKVTVHGTNVSGNTVGVLTGGTATVNVERSVISANGTGVNGATGTTVRVSDTMVSHNDVGLTGDVTSFGNNRLAAGNGSSAAPTTTLSQQ